MDSNLIENKLENECIDWISNMPDSILGKILSYVPTKDAVATSILSARWKNLFPFGVPPIKLVLDDSELLHPRENESNNLSTSFIDFVDKLLNKTLCDEPCVDRLDLKCHKHCDDAKIVSWICAALRLKLRDLELEFSLNESMTLFHCLNGCTTLSSLELGKNFELCLPKNFTLPNLTRLLLISLTFHDEDSESINELISGCPKLEDLWLSGCNLQFLGVLYIRSSLLKGVVIENSWDDSECHLVLDAPNLEFLTYNDFCATSYRVSSFKSLFGAHIDVGPSDQQLEELDEDSDDEGLLVFDDHVAQIVKACSSTKHLYLAACSIAALQRSSIQLPVFQNLIALYLGCLGFHGWTLLPRLLWNTPNLETLKFEQGVGKSQGGIADFESLVTSPPICLELHLKEIEFWVFKGEEEEFKLIEYFLKNGKVLETIDIPIHPLADMSILGRLLLLRRHSKTCEFFFPGKKM